MEKNGKFWHFYMLRNNVNLWTFFNPENRLADENQLFPCMECSDQKLIWQKLLRMPKNLGVDTFPDPVGHFEATWWPFWILQALQAVSECPLRR